VNEAVVPPFPGVQYGGTRLTLPTWPPGVPLREPPWSRVEGKYLANFQGMLPDSGSIQKGFHFWEMPSALMVFPEWGIRGVPLRRARLRRKLGGAWGTGVPRPQENAFL